MDDITETICMTSYALHMTSHRLFRTSHHFMYDIKSTISDLMSSVYVSSHPIYQWYHKHCIYDITSSISVTSYPLYLWHNIHYVWHHNPLYTLSICITSFALQMTSHPLYHTKPQYLLCHIHFNHYITPPVSDSAPTVSWSSQPLHWCHAHFWMTSHPPSVLHHMRYI